MESSVRSQLKLAKGALDKKDYNAALAGCKGVLKEDPGSYEALVIVGKAAFGLHEYKQAEAAYQRASGLDPNRPLAWQGLAELYAEIGQWDQAMQAFNTLATIAYASPIPELHTRGPGFLLRTAVYAAPPQSMERHSRRAEVLHFALATMRGTSASGVPGGCCSMAPFEAALAMLEVEGNVAGACAAATSLDATPHHAVSAAEHAGARAVAEAVGGGHAAPDVGIRGAGAELQLCAVEQVAKRLAHAFPWCPAASVHLALCLRRRSGSAARTTALVRPSDQKPAPGRRAATAADNTTNLNVLETRHMAMVIKHLPAGARRRRLIKCLHHGLHQGGAGASSAAGWLAIAELLLKEGAAEAALDAAKQGLSYLAARDLLGHEALIQADLLLKLAAGRALAAMGGVPPPGSAGYTDVWVYQALMQGAEARAAQQQLLQGVPEPSGPPHPDSHHQLDGLHLSSIQEGHEGASSMDMSSKDERATKDTATHGRSNAQLMAATEAEAWLGSLLLSGRVSSGLAPFARLAGSPSAADVTHQAKRCGAQLAIARGDIKHARQLYESLVGAAAAGRSGPQVPDHWAAAEYGTLLLVEGERAVRTAQGKHAHGHLLAAAAAAERASTAAGIVDDLYTRNCARERAGEALVSLLRSLGLMEQAMGLCEGAVEAAAAGPGGSAAVQWALKHLASLKLATGDHEGAEVAHKRAMRTERYDPQLWEGLGASYQGLGKTTAALKSYTRALELCPSRLYSLVQSGVLHYQLAEFGESAAAFARALVLAPDYPPALLGAAETALASAHRHASMGATGMASMHLDTAASHAKQCTLVHGNLQAGWKMLGDVQLQHATINPRTHNLMAQLKAQVREQPTAHPASVPAPAPDGPGCAAPVAGVVAALGARLACVKAAGHAYAHALRLDPTQGLVWGDVAMSLHQQALLHNMLALHTPAASPSHHHHLLQQQQLRRSAFRMVQGGLKMHASSDWLWALAGALAAADATATPCAPGQQSQSPDCQRALGQAEMCMARALQLNPKRVTTWAALGRMYAAQDQKRDAWAASGRMYAARMVAPGDAAYLAMMDAYEQAVSLGGSTESRLAFSTAAVLVGRGSEGEALTACSKAAAQQPALPSAYNTLGLAEEARGHYAEAAEAYGTAHALLQQQQMVGQQQRQQQQQQQGQLQQMWVTSSSSGMGAAGPVTEWASVSCAVLLNRARALACAGKAAEALQEYERLQATEEGRVALGSDPSSLLALAHTLHALGRAQDAVPVLESALAAAVAAEATSRESASGSGPSPVAAQSQRRKGVALALCRAYCASSRVRDALALVQEQTSTNLAADGEVVSKEGQLPIELQMWLTVAVGAAVTARGKGGVGAALQGSSARSSPVAEAEVREALLAWSAVHPGVDQAQVHASLGMLSADLAAADGQATRSLRLAAAAVHKSPHSAPARVRLASAALAASPAYAAASLRISPICTPAPSRRARIPGAQIGGVELHQQHLVPTCLGSGGGLLQQPTSSSGQVCSLPQGSQPVPPQLLQEEGALPQLTNPQALHHPSALRASSLMVQVAEDGSQLGLCHALGKEVQQLSKLVHAHPSSTGYWYLLALVSLHQAGSSGGQCHLYRRTLAR
ncbi:hypothetical protein DUNSADRAFT_3264 [Dunaliella salina]|uniref:Uncharacterized protein n=1 Tax=Dunaliella salina TaxID=3046 RepID=A0ABQ7GUF6_DUNSA|nr:hypothetical protein DUNSADRAFT_3264 [Dunaliella salina]|eukprot:KAF5838215.1 hypothetical protein DUNSADRAFT_3264 [Dunaliella salina]